MEGVCGTVRGVSEAGVQVIIERTMACQGCRSMNVCHGFVKKRLDLTLPKPPLAVSVGDTVRVAMEGSVLKASASAFLVPLAAVIAGLFAARALTADAAAQALCALLAFLASLVIVRYMGKRIRQPHIVEVLREE